MRRFHTVSLRRSVNSGKEKGPDARAAYSLTGAATYRAFSGALSSCTPEVPTPKGQIR
jgi:hypothetical protein